MAIGPPTRMQLVRVGVGLFVATASRGARAGHGEGAIAKRTPEVTLRAGAVLPMFVIYEFPGPLAGVTVAWPLGRHLQVAARAEVGALFFQGAQRYVGKIGPGLRVSPWATAIVSPWAQIGLGTTAHLERITVVLPQRTASATDVDAVVTADIALGVRVHQRFEFSVGWDHIVLPWSYYRVYTGTESLPNRGYLTASIGWRL